jgi:hypothetical protein
MGSLNICIMTYKPSGIAEGEDPEEGKFSAGIDTLKDLFLILKQIRDVTINGHLPEYSHILNPGKAQHVKAKLLKQFFIRAAPLMNNDDIPELRKRINNIKLSWMSSGLGSPINALNNAPVPKGYYEAFNPKFEEDMDELQLDIVLILQESGKYFMPDKERDQGL